MVVLIFQKSSKVLNHHHHVLPHLIFLFCIAVFSVKPFFSLIYCITNLFTQRSYSLNFSNKEAIFTMGKFFHANKDVTIKCQALFFLSQSVYRTKTITPSYELYRPGSRK